MNNQMEEDAVIACVLNSWCLESLCNAWPQKRFGSTCDMLETPEPITNTLELLRQHTHTSAMQTDDTRTIIRLNIGLSCGEQVA